MKKTTLSILIAAAIFASASTAMASNNNDNGPANATSTSTATATGNGGAGGHGGTGIGIGGSATGGNATGGAGGSASTGAISNDNRLTSTNLNSLSSNNTNRNDLTNKQGQMQGQMQGQAQGQQQTAKGGNAAQSQSTANSNNAAQTTALTVQGDVYAAQERNPVSTAYAPSIAPTAVCALTMSGGAQGSMFGFSVGGSYIDKNCELLEQVRAAKAIGAGEVATEMMMDVPAFAAAAKRIADRKAPKAAAASTGTAPVATATAAKPEFTDPIIRKRLGLQPL